MTARQQWSVVGGVIVILAIALFAATHFLGDELFPLQVGSDAPSFKAATVDGTSAVKTFADYKGKVVLVNIWATWCGPCKEEMPSIQRLYREFGSQGLSVVAISVDDTGSDAKIRKFAQDLGLTFEILHGVNTEIEQAFQTTGYPETFVIGREGTIRKKFIGATNWSSDGNRALIRNLLGGQTASK